MKNLLPILMVFLSAPAFSQITNGNINYELRVDQWRQLCDNDWASNDDNEVRIGLTSDANTGGTASWSSGGDGASCTGNMYVKRWQADAPSTVVSNNTLLYNCTNRVNNADAFSINYSSWEEDGAADCDHSGDACISTGTYSYVFKSTSKTPSLWWGYTGTANGSFMTGNDGDFFAKTVWRYTNGGSCGSPLLFGTLTSGTAKSHTNSNRMTPSGASADKGYTNVSGNNAADVFYQFTISSTSNVVISTNNTGTNYDTYIRLYTSSCGTQIAYNDDFGGTSRSTIEMNLCAGTYIVQVEGFSSIAGDFNLTVLATTAALTGGTIGGIASGTSVCMGSDPGAFTDAVSASGNGSAITFQWESSTTSASAGFSDIPSATGATYDPAALTQTTWFRRKVTNACGSTAYSNVIQIVVQSPSSSGMASGDYYWTGASSGSWQLASNWLTYNGSTFSVPSSAPAITDNVFIDAAGSCVQNTANTASGTAHAKNVTLRSGGQLTLGAGSTLNIASAFINNSGNTTYLSADAASAVVFTASGAAASISGSTPSSFGILTLNNTGSMTIGTETTVISTLNMNAGLVLNARLILGSTAASPGTLNHTAGTMITGSSYFRRYFGAVANSGNSGLFPWGVSAGAYERNARIEYTTAPSSGGWVDSRFVPSALTLTAGLPIINDGGVNITNYMNEGYWELTSGGGLTGGLYTLTLGRSGIETVNDASMLRIIKSPNAHISWVADGSHGTVTASAISRTGMSGYSWFVIGSNGTNPLPVNLVSMSAECKDQSVMLSWTTASETNCSHYIIERSTDGADWTQLGTIPGAGNSSLTVHYQYEDTEPVRGLAYYRLTQVDFNDDKKAPLNAVSLYCVDFGNPAETVLIYPNPASGAFTIEINTEHNGHCMVEMTDLSGRKMLQRSASLKAGSNKLFVSDENFPAGTYQLYITTDERGGKVYRLVIY